MTSVLSTILLTLAWVAAFLAAQVLLSRLAPDLAGSLYGQLTLCSIYAVGLLRTILWLDRREASDVAREERSPHPAAERRAVWLSLAGGAAGSVLWIFPLCWIAGDWAMALATLAIAGAIVGLGLRAALRSPARYDAVAMAVFAGLGAWSLTAVNLRWPAWMAAFRDSRFAADSFELPLWAMNVLLVALMAHALGSLRRGVVRRGAAS